MSLNNTVLSNLRSSGDKIWVFRLLLRRSFPCKYSLHKWLSTHMSPGPSVLAYERRLFSLLLSSASLSNFTQGIREFPSPEAAIILQLLFLSLLLCEHGKADTPSEGRQERDSKAKPERDRSALLSSAPRGESSANPEAKVFPTEWTGQWWVVQCRPSPSPPRWYFISGCLTVRHL